jgi:hypothetical protein
VVTSAFLLDRARFIVVPLGLDQVVREFTGWGLANGGPSLELGRKIVSRLRDVLHAEGRMAQMETCLDGPFLGRMKDEGRRMKKEEDDDDDEETILIHPSAFILHPSEEVAGLTPWDREASPRSQLRSGGALHALTESGTLALFLPPGSTNPDELIGWLEQAWRQTEVVRLHVLRS